ncbi:MAG: molybdopterin molybdotransferase MoeA [Saccharospirillaceae bacterium]|nr:molybdopterin molybdotransferase MoeA [Saccharospirillaceae bacterium]
MPGLTPLTQALETLLAGIEPLQTSEYTTLEYAVGRVLAEDVRSTLNVPPADNSAMDGYAVRAADLSAGGALTLLGKSMAGHPFSGSVGQGECVRIMTGALLPAGADTVVMQENTIVLDNGRIQFQAGAPQGDNVRYCGDDIRAGEIILRAGRRLRPADVGLLASIGIAQILVRPRLTVALLATGDELVMPGEPLADGQIYQSNSFTVAAVARRLGCDVLDLGTVMITPKHCARRLFRPTVRLMW